jgi:hypothetical protein
MAWDPTREQVETARRALANERARLAETLAGLGGHSAAQAGVRQVMDLLEEWRRQLARPANTIGTPAGPAPGEGGA